MSNLKPDVNRKFKWSKRTWSHLIGWVYIFTVLAGLYWRMGTRIQVFVEFPLAVFLVTSIIFLLIYELLILDIPFLLASLFSLARFIFPKKWLPPANAVLSKTFKKLPAFMQSHWLLRHELRNVDAVSKRASSEKTDE